MPRKKRIESIFWREAKDAVSTIDLVVLMMEDLPLRLVQSTTYMVAAELCDVAHDVIEMGMAPFKGCIYVLAEEQGQSVGIIRLECMNNGPDKSMAIRLAEYVINNTEIE